MYVGMCMFFAQMSSIQTFLPHGTRNKSLDHVCNKGNLAKTKNKKLPPHIWTKIMRS